MRKVAEKGLGAGGGECVGDKEGGERKGKEVGMNKVVQKGLGTETGEGVRDKEGVGVSI